MTAAASPSRRAPLGGLVLFVPSLAVTGLALGARSLVPLWFGRWSNALFAFNVVHTAALVIAVVAMLRGAVRTALAALSLLFVLPYFGAMSNEIGRAAWAVPLLIAARFGAALLVFALAVDVSRAKGPAAARGLVLAGMSLLMISVIDAAGVAILGQRRTAEGFQFRRPVDLARIEPNAIAIVGDSFVYGQSVAEREAFPSVLAAALPGQPVYNLGQMGTGLPEYREVLERLPARDTTIVCFYPNDMPPRESRSLRLQQALHATARSSLFFRIGADLAGHAATPTAKEYIDWVLKDFDPSHATFPERWRQLEAHLTAIAALSKRSARAQPILVIFPIMQDFSRYPLEAEHQRIGAFAANLGLEVIDFLPVFRRAFPQGERYLAGPNDNHFNAEVHAKVAEVLRDALAARASAPR